MPAPRRSSTRTSRWLALIIILVALAGVIWFFKRKQIKELSPSRDENRAIKASYVTNRVCAECHQKEFDEWNGSDHQRAMQPANEQTVLGDFNNSSFRNYGVDSHFFRKDGRFLVNTEGPDGSLADFEIKYTFGVRPLQQYLIEFPGGRMQALGIAWDTNKKTWFHLYPNEKIAHDDSLHWTKLYQNWNLMCADCHSTDLKKSYDPQTESYKTTWDDISVSCQSCHGPGSAHVDWARKKQPRLNQSSPAVDLIVDLKSGDPHEQVAVCFPCHSRRTRLTSDDWMGRPFLDSFLPALLTPAVYYADGQILDEDYEYGSFLQTKMYQDGVRCVDCHNAHTLKPKAESNAVCTQCHSERADRRFPKLIPKVYDTEAHHFHKPDSPGALCVNCHMPAKNYMVIDARRDHSFRIPRPDLTLKIGTPNACNSCHKDKSAQWAVDTVARWYGPNRRQETHYGEIIAAGRSGKPEAEAQLISLIRDARFPAIVRATAVELLRSYPESATQALVDASGDREPLVRVTAVDALDRLTANERISVLTPLLRDPIRAVRIQAARVLAVVSDQLSSEARAQFDAALKEYREAQLYDADMPGANLNLALLETDLKQFDRAIGYYETAIHLDPEFMPARVNLGNLFNRLGRNQDAERVYREAIEHAPKEGELHYSLGLLLAEEKSFEESAVELATAAELLPNRPRVYYNYALVLQQIGKLRKSEAALKKAYALNSNDPDVLNALAVFYAQQRRWDQAIGYAEQLERLQPEAESPKQLLRQIEMERNAAPSFSRKANQ